MNKFFLTTAIPYVNAKPHVGHALEFVQADVIRRYHKLLGDETLLLSGGDENALKNVQAAEAAGIDVQSFVDQNSSLFEIAAKKLDVDFDVFQKGSSREHFVSSQELWKRCFEKGDIYKKEYSGLYCVGCELFYEPEELNENGECYEHPGKKLETVREENYFFKLSKYQEELKRIIETSEIKIIPETRKNEILSFINSGLKDISISRSNNRAKNWGVPVPGDENQRMYVWFDALNIYRSGLGAKYNDFWPADLHIIGKGIIRFHAVYWPAFLLSAGIPLPKAIFVHGYFTVDGKKMSKTIGNVIDPVKLTEKYGADALRYYLLSQIPSTQDGDFSETRLKEVYNSDLANGLGNLVARVAKLCETKGIILNPISKTDAGRENKFIPWTPDPSLESKYIEKLNNYQFNDALDLIWSLIREADQKINQEKPWASNNQENTINFLKNDVVNRIRDIARLLRPFLPETSEKITKQFSGEKIESTSPLFPRL